MSYNFYVILHLGSLLAICLTLGALWGIYTRPIPDLNLKKLLLGFHGLLMFLIFLAGFGLMAKLKIPFPWPFWIYGKLLIWLMIGLAPFLIKKGSSSFHNTKFYPVVLLILLILLLSALFLVKLK